MEFAGAIDSIQPRRKGALGVLAALVAMVAIAGVLRFSGIGFLLPGIVEPDGGVLPYQLYKLETGAVEPKREFYAAYYPTACSRIASLWPKPSYGADERLSAQAAREVAFGYNLRVRKTVALLSLLTIPATYWLARNFLGVRWALLAALLVSWSFLQQWFAQQSRPHAAATSFFTLTMVAILRARRDGALGWYAIAGALLGLSIGALQNGIAIGLALIAAPLCSSTPRSRWFRWIVWIGAGAIAIAIARSLFLDAPPPEQAVAGPRFLLDLDSGRAVLSGHEIYLDRINFQGTLNVLHALWAYEPMLGAVSLIGVIVAYRHRLARRPTLDDEQRRALWTVLWFVVPYLIVLAAYKHSYQRFVIPLLPYLATLCAWTIAFGVRVARERLDPSLARAVAVALVALPLAAQGTLAWTLHRARSAPDTVASATAWCERNVDPARGRIVLMPPLEIGLPMTDACAAANAGKLYTAPFPWLHFHRTVPDANRPLPRFEVEWMPFNDAKRRDDIGAGPEAYVGGLRADYVIVHAMEMTRFHPAFKNVRDALLKRAQLLERFTPDTVEHELEIPLGYEDFEPLPRSTWFWRVLRARAFGPTVEIYRLPNRGEPRAR